MAWSEHKDWESAREEAVEVLRVGECRAAYINLPDGDGIRLTYDAEKDCFFERREVGWLGGLNSEAWQVHQLQPVTS